MVYWHRQSTKIQGMGQCTWRTTSARCKLLGNICTHGEVEHDKNDAHTNNHKWMVFGQTDFVLAYPQANIDGEIYMRLPKGFELNDGRTHHMHVLKLLKNIHRLKQAGLVHNKHFHQDLINLGYRQSKVDPCLYYRSGLMMVIYADDFTIASKIPVLTKTSIQELAEKFEINHEGELDEYLGVNVEHRSNGSFKLSQPLLIEQILTALGFNDRIKQKVTPALSSKILHRDAKGPEHNNSWDYWQILGQLNFLEKSTHPNIAYAVHQCAQYAAKPRSLHKHAILRIGRYLMKV